MDRLEHTVEVTAMLRVDAASLAAEQTPRFAGSSLVSTTASGRGTTSSESRLQELEQHAEPLPGRASDIRAPMLTSAAFNAGAHDSGSDEPPVTERPRKISSAVQTDDQPYFVVESDEGEFNTVTDSDPPVRATFLQPFLLRHRYTTLMLAAALAAIIVVIATSCSLSATRCGMYKGAAPSTAPTCAPYGGMTFQYFIPLLPTQAMASVGDNMLITATAMAPGTVYLYNLEAKKLAATQMLYANESRGVASLLVDPSPAASYVIVGGSALYTDKDRRGVLVKMSTTDLSRQASLTLNKFEEMPFALVTDGAYVYVGIRSYMYGAIIRVHVGNFTRATGLLFRRDSYYVRSLALSPDLSTLYCFMDSSGALFVIPTADFTRATIIPLNYTGVAGMVAHPTLPYLLMAVEKTALVTVSTVNFSVSVFNATLPQQAGTLIMDAAGQFAYVAAQTTPGSFSRVALPTATSQRMTVQQTLYFRDDVADAGMSAAIVMTPNTLPYAYVGSLGMGMGQDAGVLAFCVAPPQATDSELAGA